MLCNTDFKCVSPHIGNDQFSNILEASVITYYSWNFLKIGGWTEVSIPESGRYGGDYSQLRPIRDPNYTNGKVWESARKDWVWESGVDYTDNDGTNRNPVRATGLQVNGSGVGSGYYVNYPDGRVIFNTAIATNSTVKMEYCFRDVHVISANSPWWQEIQQNSYRVDDPNYSESSVSWAILASNRVQLPVIIVECDPRGTSEGWELGSHSLNVSRDVMFTVIAENRGQRNNLIDIIANQSNRSIWLYDTNSVARTTGYPLNYRGEYIKNNTYPILTSSTGYRYKEARMTHATISDAQEITPNLHLGVVRTTFETIL